MQVNMVLLKGFVYSLMEYTSFEAPRHAMIQYNNLNFIAIKEVLYLKDDTWSNFL